MSSNNIYIFSAPVHSGKTTLLQHWLKGKSGAKGMLMPDVEGKRMLYSIGLDQYYELENVALTEEFYEIGKYRFRKAAFEQAREILLMEARLLQPGWLVIDEIGKLEMNLHHGFEPAVTELIKMYQQEQRNGKLLLVIRDYLLEQAISHYHLSNAMVINGKQLNELE